METDALAGIRKALAVIDSERRTLFVHPDQADAVRERLAREPWGHLHTVKESTLVDVGTVYVMPTTLASMPRA